MNGRSVNQFLRACWKRMAIGARTRRPAPTRLQVERLEDRLVLDNHSAGVPGIQALGNYEYGTELTGNNVHIGQIEVGRPGKGPGLNGDPAYDGADLSHIHVRPEQVMYRAGGRTGPDSPLIADNDFHATKVAGVMIATDAYDHNDILPVEWGVASDALLHSSALGQLATGNDANQRTVLRTMQYMASITDMAATNVSWGWRTTDAEQGQDIHNNNNLNGTSLLAKGIDFLASKRNLFVLEKGNQIYVPVADGGPRRTPSSRGQSPTDAYNAIVVGAADLNEYWQWADVSKYTDLSLGSDGRVLIDLIAPGTDINVPSMVPNGNPITPGNKSDYVTSTADSATDFAAAHVTGTIALLGQAENIIHDVIANDDDLDYLGPVIADAVSAQANHPEVIKAVLMNSADKVEDRIGMTRTVERLDTEYLFGNEHNTTWDNSIARDEPPYTTDENKPDIIATRQAMPLDPQMGTGFLNADRALDEFDAGMHSLAYNQPGVWGDKGWDYTHIDANDSGPEKVVDYVLPKSEGGSWLSATLTWNRPVKLTKGASNNLPANAGTYQWFPDRPNNSDEQNRALKDSLDPTTMANLDLELYKRNPANDTWTQVWASNSTAYNVEHIFYHLDAGDADYKLRVHERTAGAQDFSGTDYALAWRREKAPTRTGTLTISGHAWEDANQNGVINQGEDEVRNVEVELYRYTYDSETQVYHNAGLVTTTTTDNYGNYSFQGLAGDFYAVYFVPPDGAAFTDRYSNDDHSISSWPYDDPTDSNYYGYTEVISLNQSISGVNAGFVDAKSGSVDTVVWNDANKDGLQSAGESGIAGVKVDLVSGTHVVATAITDTTGHAVFEKVVPGTYHLAFETAADFTLSAKDQGDDALDSDANSSGVTDDITVIKDSTVLHVDAGLQLVGATVRGRVWQDANRDGLQDDFETGISGTSVSLISNTSTLTTTTDGNGNFEFDTVAPNTYHLFFSAPPR